MATEEKAEIIELRKQSLGCKEIGRLLGISVNTIKTFCRSVDFAARAPLARRNSTGLTG